MKQSDGVDRVLGQESAPPLTSCATIGQVNYLLWAWLVHQLYQDKENGTHLTDAF